MEPSGNPRGCVAMHRQEINDYISMLKRYGKPSAEEIAREMANCERYCRFMERKLAAGVPENDLMPIQHWVDPDGEAFGYVEKMRKRDQLHMKKLQSQCAQLAVPLIDQKLMLQLEKANQDMVNSIEKSIKNCGGEEAFFRRQKLGLYSKPTVTTPSKL